MGAQLVADALAAGTGAEPLFTDLDLVVAPGDVVGVVGPNGAGKSTLLRILAGVEDPLSGTVSLSPPSALVGWSPQEVRPGRETLVEHVLRRTGVGEARRRLDAAAAELARGAPGAEHVYADVLDLWSAAGAADLEDRMPEALARVGLTVDPHRPMAELSGGQVARASLATLLLAHHDVLLLDEPTNDLDLEGLELLERFVGRSRAATVLVSHDREFLRRTVDRVLELDLHQREVRHFGGGYDAFLSEREIRRQAARQRFEDYDAQRRELTDRARRQREWGRQGARSARRDPRDPDKFVRHFNVESSETTAAAARRTQRRLDRLEQVEEPRREWELRFSIAGAPPSGTVVCTLDGAEVRYGSFRLGPVTLEVGRGDRVAITGPNGSGKTTLLSLLTGARTPDRGRASLGASVVVGGVDQARREFDSAEDLLEVVATALGSTARSEVRTLLAKFGLGGAHVLRPAATLSPGERTRAALALMQARGVNLLVLDEPTNHLDLPAIEQLEAALDTFDGTVLLVSHDRRLLEGFRATRRLVLDAGAVRHAHGAHE